MKKKEISGGGVGWGRSINTEISYCLSVQKEVTVAKAQIQTSLGTQSLLVAKAELVWGEVCAGEWDWVKDCTGFEAAQWSIWTHTGNKRRSLFPP